MGSVVIKKAVRDNQKNFNIYGAFTSDILGIWNVKTDRELKIINFSGELSENELDLIQKEILDKRIEIQVGGFK